MREGARSIFVLGRTSSDSGRSFCKRLESVPMASVELPKILRAFAHAHTHGPSVRLSARRQQHAADGGCEVWKCVPCTPPCALGPWDMRVDVLKAAHHQQPIASHVEVDEATCTHIAPNEALTYYHVVSGYSVMERDACGQPRAWQPADSRY